MNKEINLHQKRLATRLQCDHIGFLCILCVCRQKTGKEILKKFV